MLPLVALTVSILGTARHAGADPDNFFGSATTTTAGTIAAPPSVVGTAGVASPAGAPAPRPSATPSPVATSAAPTPNDASADDEDDDEGEGSTPTLSGPLPAEIPLARDLTGMLSLSPSVAPGAGYLDPSISGGTPQENRWIVNGIDLTDIGLGTPGSDGFGLTFPREFLRSVTVHGAGFAADEPDALGGVVETTLVEGGDEVRGSLFAYSSPASLEAHRKQITLPDGSPVLGASSAVDAGAVVRAPIVRGLAHIAAGIGASQFSREVSAPVGFPLETLGTRHQEQDRMPWFVTASGEHAGHSLEFTALGDGGSSPRGPQDAYEMLDTTDARFRREAFGTSAEALHYDGPLAGGSDEGALRADVSVTHAAGRYLTTFDRASDTSRYIDFRSTPITIGGGPGSYVRALDGDATTLRAMLRGEVSGAGIHRLSGGVEAATLRYASDEQYTGSPGATFVDESGTTRTIHTGVFYTVNTADDGVTPVYRIVRGTTDGNVHTAIGTRATVFFSDAWTLDRVEATVGLRAMQQSFHGSGPNAGRVTFPFTTGLAPRANVALRLGAAQQGRVFAGYARYVETVPAALVTSRLATERIAAQVDYYSDDFQAANQIPDGTVPVSGSTTHVRTAIGTAMSVAHGAAPTTEDEISAGASWHFQNAIDLTGRVIHRSLVRVLEDYATVPYDDIITGTANFGTYTIGNPGTRLGAGWKNPARDFDAVEVSAARTWGNRGIVVGSYRLSFLRGNYEGTVLTELGGSIPNASPAFDFPNATPYMAGNGKSGPLPLDRTHVLSIAGAWRTRWNVAVGGVLRYASGTPRTTLDANLAYGDAGGIVHSKRGDLGREPAITTLDLHADYAWPFHHGRTLTGAVDVFNVLDSQTVTQHDGFAQYGDGSPSPDFGSPLAYVPPRSIRLGLRYDF